MQFCLRHLLFGEPAVLLNINIADPYHANQDKRKTDEMKRIKLFSAKCHSDEYCYECGYAAESRH